MRGVFLIVTLLALVVVGLLQVRRLKAVPLAAKSVLSTQPGEVAPESLNAVPAAVRRHLNKTVIDRAKEQDAALDDRDK